jgi:DNA-binding CsgD family transcriptional regulator
MSNEKRSLSGDSAPSNPSPSPTTAVSSSGATTTPSASSIPSSTPNSNEKVISSGEVLQDPSGHDMAGLAERVAATDYLDRVGGVAERITEAAELSTVQALLSEGTQVLGAVNAVFVSFVRDNAEVTSCRFMLACDPAWCRQYLDEGLITHDPWLAYAAHHSEPVVASALTIVEPERRRAIELATRNGFASAVLVPVHCGGTHSRISLLCLGSTTHGYFEAGGYSRFKLGARVLACELHEWFVARIRRELVARSRITASDLELLRHQCQGHSSKRIAAELRVSRSSINSRFQRMNVKLGVANRRMAAQLATECGLILPSLDGAVRGPVGASQAP